MRVSKKNWKKYIESEYDVTNENETMCIKTIQT